MMVSKPSSVRSVTPVIRSLMPPPTVLLAAFNSKLRIEASASVNAPVIVSVPGLLPGATMPPSRTATAPPIEPEPMSVADDATVTEPNPSDPSTTSVPLVTLVGPW